MRLLILPVASVAFLALGLACSSSSSSDPAPAPAPDAGPAPDPSSTDDPTQKLPNGAPHTVGGNVLGLAGTGLVIQNNGGDDLAIASDGPFTFKTPVASGLTYFVRVSQQPTGPEQICTVTSAIGTIADNDVSDVLVHCLKSYAVQVTVSGLTGTGLVLLDNGGDPLSITQNGQATFALHIQNGQPYAVTIGQQPTGQTCTVNAGSGTVADATVTTPTVSCN